jgi:hypothetical protein
MNRLSDLAAVKVLGACTFRVPTKTYRLYTDIHAEISASYYFYNNKNNLQLF